MHHLKKFFATRTRRLLLVIALGIVAFIVYKSLGGEAGESRYILAKVARGDVATVVSGTGQVAALNQVTVKARATGDVQSLMTPQGSEVFAGQALVRLDDSEARKAVRDAQANLESARLSLERLKQSTADIDAILEDAFSDISNAFLDFPSIVSTAEDVILGSTLAPGQQDNIGFYRNFVGQMDDKNYPKVVLFVESARTEYLFAREQYDDVLLLYKSTTRSSPAADIEKLLTRTIATSKAIAQVLKSEQNLLDFLSDYANTYDRTLPALATSYKSSLRTNIGLVNGHLSSLAATANSIANAPLDIRSQELVVAQRENTLADATAALADYTVRAPLAGEVAELLVKRGDSVTTGASVATIVSQEQLAVISLNEVDIAQVARGQVAVLTFDALPDVRITGTVSQIDTLGTVSQGVVTYSAQIAFDAGTAPIKPGMSVAATITTTTKKDVLMVPSAAVKNAPRGSYVELIPGYQSEAPTSAARGGVVFTGALSSRTVTTGIVGETTTEIVEGLAEGEWVVVRSIVTSGAAPTSNTNRIPGVGGGTFRAISR
jgi:RND family efflux transporter MFP subunit